MSRQFIPSSRNPNATEPVEFLNKLFEQSAMDRVADIHFQRTDKECRIKLRIAGGILIQHAVISTEWAHVIDEKIRAKAQLTTTDHKTPQDSRISLKYDNVEIDVRVAITPGVNDCQLIVCRLLNQSSMQKLADIDMPVTVRDALRRVIEEPHGLFLVCGPTGSGKTTTLYAILNELNDNTRNIVTVENPVEYRIVDFHQINVDGEKMTFASALRTVLRQDPDVILVGEIRDLETANIAVQAAMTGHLVLSTIHANDAPGAITRLVDMGIDHASLNAALRGVVAQRLVRKIAPEADVTRIKADDDERAWLRLNGIYRDIDTEYIHVLDPIHGYKGVTPVMEMILIDSRVRKVMTKGEAEIYQEASRQPQFETLAQAAERLAFSGRTTLTEARHLTSGQDAPNIQNRRLGQVLVAQGIINQADIDGLLIKQSTLRSAGQRKKLGDLLLDAGLCNADQIHKAVGFTAEAKDVLLRVARTEEKKQLVYALVVRWSHGTTSLFDLAVSAGFASQEEIYAAYDN